MYVITNKKINYAIANKKSELFKSKNYIPSAITCLLSDANLDKFIH